MFMYRLIGQVTQLFLFIKCIDKTLYFLATRKQRASWMFKQKFPPPPPPTHRVSMNSSFDYLLLKTEHLKDPHLNAVAFKIKPLMYELLERHVGFKS